MFTVFLVVLCELRGMGVTSTGGAAFVQNSEHHAALEDGPCIIKFLQRLMGLVS
jgi:hypothetical protein